LVGSARFNLIVRRLRFCLSYLAILRVFKENTFAASTIAVEPEKRVVSTGPYAYVRHPMYAAGILLLAASPLALGSWWGLIVFVPIMPVLVWRLLDEEKYLKEILQGYVAYCDSVKSRLIPFLW
jgi:protein-S-isoprenylcysteine O-methyltransferase Ste14